MDNDEESGVVLNPTNVNNEISSDQLKRVQKSRENLSNKFSELFNQTEKDKEPSMFNFNIKTISISILGLYIYSIIFTVLFLKEDFYIIYRRDNNNNSVLKEVQYKKLFLVSLYFMLYNILYIFVFYYIMKNYTKYLVF